MEEKLFAFIEGDPFRGGFAVHGPFTKQRLQEFMLERDLSGTEYWWAVPLQQDV
jgi:hypothetical protein